MERNLINEPSSVDLKRDDMEIYIFSGIQGLFLTARYIVVGIFIYQAVMHSRYQGEKRDKLTYLTFLFLAISQLFLCTNLVLQLY